MGKLKLDKNTLVAACKAVCVFCKEGVPYNAEKEQHANLYHCKAWTIRSLFLKAESRREFKRREIGDEAVDYQAEQAVEKTGDSVERALHV